MAIAIEYSWVAYLAVVNLKIIDQTIDQSLAAQLTNLLIPKALPFAFICILPKDLFVFTSRWNQCLRTKWCLPCGLWCSSGLRWRATRSRTWCRRHSSTFSSTSSKAGKHLESVQACSTARIYDIRHCDAFGNLISSNSTTFCICW